MRPVVVALAALLLAGCAADASVLVLGATTSTQDAGLLDVLVEAFEEATGIRVRAVVGGTGEIVEKARRGDVDVLLTHSPARERALLAEGVAVERRPVMSDRFVVAGPAGDPADARGALDAADALRRIHDAHATFASRGDASGTHDKELELWARAGLDPASFDRAWYKETGAGQGTTLLYASERGAYVLVDDATLRQHHTHGRATGVTALFGGDPALRNQYAVSLLNATRHPERAEEAARFAAWLVGADGRDAIGSLRLGGEPLFTPDAEDPEG